MSNNNTTTTESEIKEKLSAKDITKEERVIISCKAIGGESVTKLSCEYGVNRQFIYNQKNKTLELLDENFDNEDCELPKLVLDKTLIERTVISCMVICKGSIEDTQEFMETVYNIHVSVGKISTIINEASKKAEKWNLDIRLNNISIGAHDEIFQGDRPVLVGVDPMSTFIYLLEGEENRDSVTWGCALLDKEEQGLHLETSVNDGGTGLVKGIKEAFENIEIQYDVFHAEKDISAAVYSMERTAYKHIKDEEKIENKCLKAKETKEKDWEKYNEMVHKTKVSIDIYDTLKILYVWLIEIFSIGGYLYNEKEQLLDFVINEMSKFTHKSKQLEKGLKFISNHKEGLLQFVKKAESLMKDLSEKEGIDIDILNKMWKQRMYSYCSKEYNLIEAELGVLLGCRYNEVRMLWDNLLKQIVRASSIVECTNSLIRPYLSLKRAVPNRFLPLLQFYFNTRKYRRSRCKERVGKSPVELLTGQSYPDPLSILGY